MLICRVVTSKGLLDSTRYLNINSGGIAEPIPRVTVRCKPLNFAKLIFCACVFIKSRSGQVKARSLFGAPSSILSYLASRQTSQRVGHGKAGKTQSHHVPASLERKQIYSVIRPSYRRRILLGKPRKRAIDLAHHSGRAVLIHLLQQAIFDVQVQVQILCTTSIYNVL